MPSLGLSNKAVFIGEDEQGDADDDNDGYFVPVDMSGEFTIIIIPYLYNLLFNLLKYTTFWRELFEIDARAAHTTQKYESRCDLKHVEYIF